VNGLPSEQRSAVNPSSDVRISRWKGLAIVLAMAFLFLVWGIFIFFMVGDKGQPGWNFGVVKDTPGESAYSTERE
jgi:hypothetical protein